MIRHPAPARPGGSVRSNLAELPWVVPAAGRPDHPDGHESLSTSAGGVRFALARDLPALRAAVLTMPDSAPRQLQRLLLHPVGPGETGHQADITILLAEAFLHRRDTTAALHAARRAVHVAESLHPVDTSRRLCAYGVAADIVLYAGRPAVDTYRAYLHELTATGDWAGDELVTIYARAAYAVAIYRDTHREHGLRLLADLCEWVRGRQGRHHAVTVALVEGLVAMRVGCSVCSGRAVGRRVPDSAAMPAPLPGGLLLPDLTDPDPAYLASRVHDCLAGPR